MFTTKSYMSVALAGVVALTAGPALLQAAEVPSGPVSANRPVDPELDCPAAQIEHNKHLATLFRIEGDPDVAYANMTSDYIQHNPLAYRMGQVNGVHGRDEFKLLLDQKKAGRGGPRPLKPGQPPEDTTYFIMATCNYSFLMKKAYLDDPQNPGKFYETFSFDLWRIVDGKLAEHWDNATIPNPVPPMLQIPFSQMPPPGAVPAGAPAGGK